MFNQAKCSESLDLSYFHLVVKLGFWFCFDGWGIIGVRESRGIDCIRQRFWLHLGTRCCLWVGRLMGPLRIQGWWSRVRWRRIRWIRAIRCLLRFDQVVKVPNLNDQSNVLFQIQLSYFSNIQIFECPS